MPHYIWAFALAALLFGVPAVPLQAQNACQTLVETALATARTACIGLEAESACYGNVPLNITFTEDVEDATFTEPGDEVGLALLDTLTMDGFDENSRGWGIVTMHIRLNRTEQTAFLYGLGEVTLQNTGDPAANVPAVVAPVMTNQGLNIRSLPEVQADLLTTAFTGDPIRLTGRTSDENWVRVELLDGTVGWAAAVAFDTDDLAPLETVPGNNETPFGPMQSFTLRTPPQQAACTALPPNGVLLQTPGGETNAVFMINDQSLVLPPETTVFLSTNENDRLRVDVLEGEADLSADVALLVTAGNGVEFQPEQVPIPRPYDINQMGRLPLDELPRTTFAAIDFSRLLSLPDPDGTPLAGLGQDAPCTIGAVSAANLREEPAPNARVRHVMQPGQSAQPDGRAQGGDGLLWWRLAANVWVSSNAVQAVGTCGTLPVYTP